MTEKASHEEKRIQEIGTDESERAALLYRQLFHQAPEGFIIYEANGFGLVKTLDVSKGALEMTGYSREEYLALPPLTSMDELPPQEMKSIATKALKEGHFEFETCLIAKDGRKVPVEMFLSIPEKNIVLIRARDITDRISVRAVRKLRAEIWKTVADKSLSEYELISKLLTKIVESLDVHVASVFQLDKDNNIYRRVLAQSTQEYRFKKNQNIPFEFVEYFSGIEAVRLPQDLDKAPEDIEKIWMAAIESSDAKSILAIPFGEDISKPEAFITYSHYDRVRNWCDEAMFVEVTKIILNRVKEIRADRALAAEREYFYHMTDKSPESIIEIDHSGVVLYFNKRAESITGYAKNEMVGRNIFKSGLLTEESAEIAIERLNSHIRTGVKVSDLELSVRRKDGTLIITEINASTMKENFLITGRVITDKKRMEQALKESRMRERILTESNEGILNWMHVIAHELRTPLNAVIGFSTLGFRKFETLSMEKTKNFFLNIHQACERMLKLVNDLLDLARMERGQMAYNMSTYDLVAILDNAKRVVESLLLEKDLELVIESSDINATVECDASRIGQVFLNLLSNSIKYSSNGDKIAVLFAEDEILLGRRAMDARIPALRFSISDEGMGIPPDQLEYIFDKFTQSRESDTRKGTGLGLSICREIIKAHQGKITVESEEGKGATFHIVIPYSQLRSKDNSKDGAASKP